MVEGDVLKVNYLNKSVEDISISLSDATQEFYREKGDNSLSYGKMLNLENLPSGAYYLTFPTGDNVYYYSFSR
jgi:hypothetical protein